MLSVADLVKVHRRLLAQLGIRRLAAAIGGSLGAMQVLQWTLDYPDELEAAILVCGSARLSAQNIAFSSVARSSILRDEHFAGGDYYDTGARPDAGLAVARMLAHLTYVSDVSLERKFGRRLDRRRADARLRRELRGRELPRAPGELVPAPLRRELLPRAQPR